MTGAIAARVARLAAARVPLLDGGRHDPEPLRIARRYGPPRRPACVHQFERVAALDLKPDWPTGPWLRCAACAIYSRPEGYRP